MPDDAPMSRQSFDEAAARLGISGTETHMDDLFRQVQGVLAGTASLKAVNVDGTEPDMAFSPAGTPSE